MPLLHMKCDSRVESSFAKPGTYWCPSCDKEVKRDETYKVGKRFSATGVGMIMAMSMTAAYNMEGYPSARPTNAEVTSTFREARRQKRKKLHGLRTKQQRQMRQKRR